MDFRFIGPVALLFMVGCSGAEPVHDEDTGAPAALPGDDAGPDASAPDASAPDASAPDGSALDASAPVATAIANAALAQPLLRKSHGWLLDQVRLSDPVSGLINDSLDPSIPWSTRDTASDMYPYFTWAAYLLDRSVFDGQARRILEFERTRTTLPATGALPYSFDTRTQTRLDLEADDLLFGAAEYVKDGLTPIIELTGRGPWYERMEEIELDSFRYGQFEPAAGTLPLDHLETNGDHLQSLPRLYAATGDQRYRDAARKIVQHYFVDQNYLPTKLTDHGCEIIGGLALFYAVEKQLGSPEASQYEEILGRVVDHIATYGLTPEGLMHSSAHLDTPGPVPAKRGALSDNWGQNFTAFLIYAQLAGKPEYFDYIDRALRSLGNPEFEDYPWGIPAIDGLADSMEGVIALLASRPIEEASRWLDTQAARLAELSWDPDKYGGNTVRTALLYVRTKTEGTWVWPWRRDVSWGAVRTPEGLVLTVHAQRSWEGRLVFDSARFRDTWGLAQDYPRMNYLPAYFVAEPSTCYQLTHHDDGTVERVRGSQLLEGLPLRLDSGARFTATLAETPCAD